MEFDCYLCGRHVLLEGGDLEAYRGGPQTREDQVCNDCLPQAIVNSFACIRAIAREQGHLTLGEQN